MFTRLLCSLFFLTSMIPLSAATSKPALSGNYLVLHQVTEMTNTSFTLDDGSTWEFECQASPLFAKGNYVWIVPILQEGSFTAVFFTLVTCPTTATLTTPSTTLTITSTTGNITLSDGSQWTLDAYYKNYTAGWQVGDPITLAGRHNEYFLINGNAGSVGGPTYSLVTNASTKTSPKKNR